MGKKVEVEGGEIALQNEFGDIVIVPKKFAREVKDMVKDGCNDCIDAFATNLPEMSDFAEDGTLIPSGTIDPKKPPMVQKDNTNLRSRLNKLKTPTASPEPVEKTEPASVAPREVPNIGTGRTRTERPEMAQESTGVAPLKKGIKVPGTDNVDISVNEDDYSDKAMEQLSRQKELDAKNPYKKKLIERSTTEKVGDWVVGNVEEKIIDPIKKGVTAILPDDIEEGLEGKGLKTARGKYDNSEGKLPWVGDKTVEEIQQMKNLSFAQISSSPTTKNLIIPEKTKERMVNSIYPQGYEPEMDQDAEGLKKFKAVQRFLDPKSKEGQIKRLPGKRGDNREDIFRLYAGLPQKYDTFTASAYKPGANSDTAVTFKNDGDKMNYLLAAAHHTDLFKKLSRGEITPESIAAENKSDKKGGEKIHKASFRDNANNVMWNATLGIGFDDDGKPYLSFYDNWDLAGKDDNKLTDKLVGSPIEIYDRIPLTETAIKNLSRTKYAPQPNKASDTKSLNSDSDLYDFAKVDPLTKDAVNSVLSEMKNRYKAIVK